MIINLFLLSLTIFLLFFETISIGMLLLVIGILGCAYFYILKTHKHNSILEIDFYANKSAIKSWNAPCKITFALVLLLISVFTKSTVISLYIFLSVSFVTVFVGKVNLGTYVKLLSIPITFIMLSLLTILISLAPSAVGIINIPFFSSYLVVTTVSQKSAVVLLSRVLGSLSCLYMISLSTPMGDIVAALKGLRVPVLIIDLMYLIYRYIFVLLHTFNNMQTAAASRLGFRGYSASIKTILALVSNLFFISLRKASDNFDALEARLYNGNISFLSEKRKLLPAQVLVFVALLTPIILFGIWRAI